VSASTTRLAYAADQGAKRFVCPSTLYDIGFVRLVGRDANLAACDAAASAAVSACAVEAVTDSP
jgi:hypothetical protein